MPVVDPHQPELPPPFGVNLRADGNGVDAAVYAANADAVELCLLDGEGPDTVERRVLLDQRAHGVHFAHVPGVGPGQRYGLRAHGPWDPSRGRRYNPAKLLLDPYARALDGEVQWRPEVYGHVVGPLLAGDPDVRDDRDSAPYVPRGVVVSDGFDWERDRPPAVPWSQTVLYEAHVRGLTQLHPGVPEEPSRAALLARDVGAGSPRRPA